MLSLIALKVLYKVKKLHPEVESQFIWVGQAYNGYTKAWINESEKVFERSIIHKDSKVALIKESPKLFEDIIPYNMQYNSYFR